jgi:hypothetical protein
MDSWLKWHITEPLEAIASKLCQNVGSRSHLKLIGMLLSYAAPCVYLVNVCLQALLSLGHF